MSLVISLVQALALGTAHAGPVEVAAGSTHTCIRRTDGSVWCWGGLAGDKIKAGGVPSHLRPSRVAGITDARRIAAGGSQRTCAIQGEGAVWCWLVDAAPERVGSLNATDISVGEAHACAVTTDGGIWCWGYNARGQLGDGSTTHRAEPVQVRAITGAVQVAAGWFHTCALNDRGQTYCWGAGAKGQLGHGQQPTMAPEPVRVTGLDDAQVLDAGSFHTCAARASGEVACWGAGGAGQLGTGGRSSSATPIAVSGLTDAVDIGVGLDHACAVGRAGTVVCWGNNEVGQLGNAERRHHVVHRSVEGLTAVRALTAGSQHTCVLSKGGSLACFGQNFTGQLGDGTTERRTLPVTIIE